MVSSQPTSRRHREPANSLVLHCDGKEEGTGASVELERVAELKRVVANSGGAGAPASMIEQGAGEQHRAWRGRIATMRSARLKLK